MSFAATGLYGATFVPGILCSVAFIISLIGTISIAKYSGVISLLVRGPLEFCLPLAR